MPVCHPSPSVMDARATAGLTLVELVVAVPLAAGIALMAFYAVRSATQSARILQDAVEENSALVGGLTLALREADTWSSHADPDFPFMRGYMSAEIEDGTGSRDHAANKRLFRPMRVAHALYKTNGADVLPGDERSWYYGPALTGVHLHTSIDLNGTVRTVSPVRYGLDPVVGSIKLVWDPGGRILSSGLDLAGRSSFVADNQGRNLNPFVATIPAGWEAWHLHGDFASVSNLDRALALEANPAMKSEDVQQALLRIYRWVGHLGVAAYGSPGTLVFPVTAPVNRARPSSEWASNRWGWGEPPWSLTPDTGALHRKSSDAVPKHGTPGLPVLGENSSPAPASYDVTLGAPANARQCRVEFLSGTQWDSTLLSIGNDNGQWLLCSPVDYIASLDGSVGMTVRRALYPVRGFWNPQAVFATNDPKKPPEYAAAWDETSLLNGVVMRPYRLMNQADRKSSDLMMINANGDEATYDKLEYGDLGVMEARHRVSTGILPAQPSDPRGPVSDGTNLSLRQEVLRFNQMGYDRVKIRICLNRMASSKTYELEVVPLGSTYRGARWFWGLRSNGAMGDSGVSP